MIPCGRHPVMADMLVTLVSAVHRPTRLSFPVVIWSKYIDSEVRKCSSPSNGNVSRLYPRLSTSSSRLGDESRPWFWPAVLYRSQNKNDFLGRSKDAETLFGKISFFLDMLEKFSKSEDTWKPLCFILNRLTLISALATCNYYPRSIFIACKFKLS